MSVQPPRSSGAATGPEEVLDWSEEEIEAPELALALGDLPGERVTERDIDVYRETTRSQLARWLMALLTLVVVALLLYAGLELAGVFHQIAGVGIGDLAQTVLTPVVTLSGTALGFYYGAHSATGSTEPRQRRIVTPQRNPGYTRQIWRKIW
jgi:hypothetical protein